PFRTRWSSGSSRPVRARRAGFPRASRASIDARLDDRGECVPGPIQSRFHRSEVAFCDLGDLLVRLALELAEHEHLPVMLRQLGNGVFHQLAQMALAVHVVRARRRVLELQRPIFVLPVRLDGLEEDERIARAITQLVLGEVRRDGVHPGRELLRAVEAMEMPVHPDEDFLYQVFRLLTIADRAINEVQEARLVALDELLERPILTTEECTDDSRIVLGAESLSRRRSGQHCPFHRDFGHNSPLDPTIGYVTGRVESTISPLLPSTAPGGKGRPYAHWTPSGTNR